MFLTSFHSIDFIDFHYLFFINFPFKMSFLFEMIFNISTLNIDTWLLFRWIYLVLMCKTTMPLCWMPSTLPRLVLPADVLWCNLSHRHPTDPQELLEEGCGYLQCRLLFAAENNGQNRSLYIWWTATNQFGSHRWHCAPKNRRRK